MPFKPKGVTKTARIAFLLIIGFLLIRMLSHLSGNTLYARTTGKGTKRVNASKFSINVTTRPKPPTTCKPATPNLFFDYIEEMRKLNEAKVNQDDPRLIKLIRDYYILPPSSAEYNLADRNKVDYAGQRKDNMIPQLVKEVPSRGLYIDCGAFDGEEMSHTLYFEKTKLWSGLLIEADPEVFRKLQAKNRKAYTMNACLNTQPHPAVMTFNLQPGLGRIVEGTFQDAYKHHTGFETKERLVKVQCFPLYSVLLALGQTHVDFFSLDVEGNEVDILKTLPWDKVNITYIMAEFSHGEGGKPALQAYLGSKHYETIKEFPEDVLVKRIYNRTT